jgi:hypothetical protein
LWIVANCLDYFESIIAIEIIVIVIATTADGCEKDKCID